MHKIFTAAILGAMIAVAQTQTPAPPTAAELLQRGIFAQETAGDLEGAAKIYRQIVDSHPIQREIAAQAQYRLGITLLEKGDAALASQEIQRLGWDFPDYKELIASAKGASTIPRGAIVFSTGQYRPLPGPAVKIPFTVYSAAEPSGSPEQLRRIEQARADLEKRTALEANHDAEYDFSKTVTMTGTITQVQWVNPSAWLNVNPVSIEGQTPGNITSPIRVSLESADGRVRGGKDALNVGDQVIVVGAPALDGASILQATRISSANGGLLYLRGAATPK